jgi:hypothetical protein
MWRPGFKAVVLKTFKALAIRFTKHGEGPICLMPENFILFCRLILNNTEKGHSSPFYLRPIDFFVSILMVYIENTNVNILR